jgi:hypothetical protein
MAAKKSQATCSLATQFKQEQVLELVNALTGELVQNVRCIADTMRSRSKNAFAARRAFTVVDLGATDAFMDACRKLVGGPHFQAVVPCYLQHHRDSPYFTLSFDRDDYCGSNLYIAVPAASNQESK